MDQPSLLRCCIKICIDEEPKKIGSGALVSQDGYILTAYHNIFDPHNNTRNIDFFAKIGKEGNNILYHVRESPFSVIQSDLSNDIALIKLDLLGQSVSDYLPIDLSYLPKEGEIVHTISYDVIDSERPMIRKASISSASGANFILEGHGYPGMSGSPVLLNHQIVGIVQAIRKNGAQIIVTPLLHVPNVTTVIEKLPKSNGDVSPKKIRKPRKNKSLEEHSQELEKPVGQKASRIGKKDRNALFFHIGCAVGNKFTIANVGSCIDEFPMLLQWINQAELSQMESVQEIVHVANMIAQGTETKKQERELIFSYLASMDKFVLELRDACDRDEYRWFLVGNCILRIATLAEASNILDIGVDDTIEHAAHDLAALHVALRPPREISKLIKLLIETVQLNDSDNIVKVANRTASAIGMLL